MTRLSRLLYLEFRRELHWVLVRESVQVWLLQWLERRLGLARDLAWEPFLPLEQLRLLYPLLQMARPRQARRAEKDRLPVLVDLPLREDLLGLALIQLQRPLNALYKHLQREVGRCPYRYLTQRLILLM